MSFKHFAVPLLIAPLLLALPACTTETAAPAPQPPRAAPKPPVTATPLPPRRAETWLDAPQTAGDWSYQPAGGGSASLFRAPDGRTLLTLACDRDRRMLVLSRPATASAPAALRILTTSDTLLLDAQPVEGPPATLSARLAATHRIVDAMAFSRGRFAVETAGLPTLYLPSWPEVTRAAEDCR